MTGVGRIRRRALEDVHPRFVVVVLQRREVALGRQRIGAAVLRNARAGRLRVLRDRRTRRDLHPDGGWQLANVGERLRAVVVDPATVARAERRAALRAGFAAGPGVEAALNDRAGGTALPELIAVIASSLGPAPDVGSASAVRADPGGAKTERAQRGAEQLVLRIGVDPGQTRPFDEQDVEALGHVFVGGVGPVPLPHSQ